MIKIVHIGDLHIGGTSPEKATASIRFLIDQLEDSTSPAYHPDLIICTGDTTEKKLHVNDDNLKPLLELIRTPFRKVFLQGTPYHEPYGFLENLRQASGESFILMDKPDVISVPGLNLRLGAIPAISRAMLEKWAALELGEAFESPGENLRALFELIASKWESFSGPKILLGHWAVTGCQTPTGQTLFGSDTSVGLEDIALANARLVLLGHIHKVQEWHQNGTLISYCGSSHNCNWGELDHKSFSVYTIAPDELVTQRVPYPSKPMVKIVMDFTGEKVDGRWKYLLSCPDLPEVTDVFKIDPYCEYKVCYSVPNDVAALAEIDDMYVRAEWFNEGISLSALQRVTQAGDRSRIQDIGSYDSTDTQYQAVCKAKDRIPRPGAIAKAIQMDEEGVGR